MSNWKTRGHGKPFPQRYYYRRIRFSEYDVDVTSEKEYPTFILRLVRLFGSLTFSIFFVGQRIYPCGGKISWEEHAKRARILAMFSAIMSLILTTAGYFGLSLVWSRPPYKGVSQALLLTLLFLFYAGSSGMAGLLGLPSAYDKEGFLKRSPVNVILDERRIRRNRLKQSKTKKRQTAYL
jgi:hypothetical protein